MLLQGLSISLSLSLSLCCWNCICHVIASTFFCCFYFETPFHFGLVCDSRNYKVFSCSQIGEGQCHTDRRVLQILWEHKLKEFTVLTRETFLQWLNSLSIMEISLMSYLFFPASINFSFQPSSFSSNKYILLITLVEPKWWIHWPQNLLFSIQQVGPKW